ncbi:hypothetical protein EPUS_04713 [Endocarpon pusillum Z07020]|uniref:Uncharacterized protein n=1 Tax=Endocarpon pusillum (strain Z07020 / HMAS-L-300199) TaxID=1263415 RepID=U1HJL5_ENDPU|nr:uncharacterized protein EPUS_04713 [Endocarpon pusillum Z07020]ERF70435.1 hypothetical protein EPUS_04713 [Endocarpon pusillum Z07020]
MSHDRSGEKEDGGRHSDRAQQRDVSGFQQHQSSPCPGETDQTTCLRVQQAQINISSEQNNRANQTQHTHTSEREEHRRETQEKDEMLRHCYHEISKLRASVESYTKQKLMLQPQQALKDSDIAFRYQDLCTAIADWEEIQFGHLDSPLQNLEQIRCSQMGKELVNAYLGFSDEAKIAVTHPMTENIMLTYWIHRHLEKFVSVVKHGMRTMQPPRDELLVGMVGSELQRVLSQTPAMLGQRDEYLEGQCRTLAEVLMEFLPDDQKANFRFAGLMTIFKDAADLAHQIQLTPQSYGYDTAFWYSDPNSARVLFDDERREYKIINAAYSQPIRDNDIIEVGPNGRIGKKLCVIHPALVRRGQGERGDMVLTQATILASLDKPISRPQRANTQPKIEVKIEPREHEQAS